MAHVEVSFVCDKCPTGFTNMEAAIDHEAFCNGAGGDAK